MNLLADIAQQCLTNPSAIAMREGKRTMRYRQLALKAGTVAYSLQQADILPDSRVALAMDRGIDAVCALLGILAAGCTYLPLDINSPLTRQSRILNDADVAVVIGDNARASSYQQYNWLDYPVTSERQLVIPDINTEQLGAILYTSGSTGMPKGVAISHRAMLVFSNWAKQLVNLNQDDRIASLAPFFFDLSVFDIFACLSAGASIDFVPSQLTMAPSQFSAWLAQHEISGIYTVPSVLGFLALKGNLENIHPACLRFVLFAGEVFATPLLTTLTGYLPNTQFYNFYGPTETNVCAYWQVITERLRDDRPIPIGHPACGNQLAIAEQTGELLVKGPTLMSGYWSQGTLESPYADQHWYPTGDQVSINTDGEYCYHGRLDRMLKCSGFRVEPAEIEHALKSLPGVVDCAVIGIADETAGQRPAATVVIQPGTSIQNLRRALQQQLPAYMVPARWKTAPALPLLANGKIDYPAISQLFPSI